MKFNYGSFLFLLIIVVASCKKTENPSTPVVPNPPDTTITPPATAIDVPADLYIAGLAYTDSFYTLRYWNNGKAFTIHSADRLIADSRFATPTGIFGWGSDVYITGYVFKNDNSYPIVGTYWKNGIAVNLTDTLNRGNVKSVFISNNDVYMVSSETNRLTNLVQYWKNGVAFPPLVDGPIAADATSIFVSANDVYVAGNENLHGFNYSAVYWKNGNRVVLSNDSVEFALASAICVSGNDVYVAGEVFNGNHIEAVYWKNGVRTILSSNDPYDEHTTAIAVSGNDVYITGYAYHTAKYWKNSSAVNLTDGSYDSRATSLFIANGNIYIAGYEDDVAKYWKNGTAHLIQAKQRDENTFAYSIFATN